MLHQFSALWARGEIFTAASLAMMVTLLILLNVITRTLGAAIFWVDELAIFAMIWMTFLGASAALHHRTAVSVHLLTSILPPRWEKITRKAVDAIVFLFALAMMIFCWIWFSPLKLIQADFDLTAFQSQSFNFIYTEPTLTLGVPKYLFWMVMWIFSIGALIHATSHLLTWSPKDKDAKESK